MKFKIYLLQLLYIIILIISLGTLACHIAQLALLSTTSSMTWWPHYIPYTLYYVGSIFSVLCSTSLILLTCIYSKSIWIIRTLSLVNLLLTIAFIVYISLESGIIPWPVGSADNATTNQKGFVTYCSTNYSTDNLVYQRCWLSNGSWLGLLIYGFFWFLLSIYSWLLLEKSDLVNDNDYDSYDFKQDVPMSLAAPEIPPHHLVMCESPAVSQEDSYYHYTSRGRPLHHTMGYGIDPLQNSSGTSDPYYHFRDDEQQSNIISNTPHPLTRKVSKTYLEEENQPSQS